MVSTFIGAAISAGTNYLVATKTEKATEKREKASRLVEVNRAARLVHAESLNWRIAASFAIKNGCWYEPKLAALSIEAWEKFSPTLAELPYDTWSCVHFAYRRIPGMDLLRSVEVSCQTNHPISQETIAILNNVISDSDLAIAALVPYVAVSPPPDPKKLR